MLNLIVRVTILISFFLSFSMAAESQAENWEFETISGQTIKPFEQKETKGIVLLFVSRECPVANGYQPAIRKLTETYSAKGFTFFQIHPDPDTTVKQAKKHVEDFEIKSSVVIDADQAIAKSVKAKITPEAFVISKSGAVLYRGRIDDSWARYGRRKTEGLSYDLKNALEDVLANREVKVKETKALGCHIYYE